MNAAYCKQIAVAIMREDKVLFQKKNLMQFVVRILIFFFLQKRTGYDFITNTINIFYLFIFAFSHLQGHEDLDAKKAFVFYRKMLLWSDRLYL